MSKVMWEWIPNVGSKAGESVKVLSLYYWIFTMILQKNVFIPPA